MIDELIRIGVYAPHMAVVTMFFSVADVVVADKVVAGKNTSAH